MGWPTLRYDSLFYILYKLFFFSSFLFFSFSCMLHTKILLALGFQLMSPMPCGQFVCNLPLLINFLIPFKKKKKKERKLYTILKEHRICLLLIGDTINKNITISIFKTLLQYKTLTHILYCICVTLGIAKWYCFFLNQQCHYQQ